MSSSGRNRGYDAAFQRAPRDSMRTGYVLVSEERESGSEYSSSTCCSSCASSCSGSESSDDDGDDAYLSDCSACWARRNAQRRGRAGWREADEGDSGSGRRAEQVWQDHHRHHHRRRGQGQHRHGETRQRSHSSRNNNNNTNTNNVDTSTSTNTNTYDTAPAYRSLTERILATTRRIHQDEESLRRFQTWMRVLDDIQRRSHVGLGDSTAVRPTPAAMTRTGQGLPVAAAVRRASEAPSRAAAAAAAAASEEAAMRRARVSSRGARGYFMSGGRSISTNRRRRL
ncbi:hypothetical protein V8C35DRAFT_329776 [Trichoderma chlorosporum]